MESIVENEAKVLLCCCGSSRRVSERLGIDDGLGILPWVCEASSSVQARSLLGSGLTIAEAWVLGCSDMGPLNLAAGLRMSKPDLKVYLLSEESSGSLLSRCAAAGVVPCIGREAVAELFETAKRRYGMTQIAYEGNRLLLPSVKAIEGSASTKEADSIAGTLGSFNKKAVSSSVVVRPVDEEQTPLGSVVGLQHQTDRNLGSSRDADSSRCVVLSVVSGSGGSGKSSVSSLMGVYAQSIGLRTAVVDADFQFGDVAWLMGVKDAVDSPSLLRQGITASSLSPNGDIPAVVRPPDNLEQSEESSACVKELIEALRRSFDVLVVNTGSFWMDAHLDLIEASDKVLFLADQRPSSLRACSKALDLCVRCGLPTKGFLFALNRCGKQTLLSPVDASCALKGVKVSELRDGGREVSELLGAGLPLELAHSKNPFAQDVSRLAGDVFPDFGKSPKAQPVGGRSGRRRRGRLRDDGGRAA